MDKLRQSSWLSWVSVGVLAVLCGVLAILQNHWIGEVSRAEKERLQQQLQNSLSHLSREFNTEISNACAGLLPGDQEVEALGREKAYSNRYTQWRQSHERMFQRVALAVPGEGAVALLMFSPETGQFATAAWPEDWSSVRDQLLARSMGGFAPIAAEHFAVITVPRFGGPGAGGARRPGPPPEREWLILELNLDYVRTAMLPELLHRYLASGDNRLEYQAEVVSAANPAMVIYKSAPDVSHIEQAFDASIPLFNVNYPELMHPRGRQGGFHGGPPAMRGRFHDTVREGQFRGGGPPPPGEMGPGKWRLLVRHQAGSLEAVVARARWQNLATSLGILILILATVGMLVRFSRRAQKLAEMQMNFVAGVSHELRTPLTVIRTAAFNLRGKLGAKPEQVERYSALIQAECEKLTRLLEQVLLFSRARAGHAIRSREPVEVETIIDQSISAAVPEGSRYTVEKHVDASLPPVLADELAMKHAVQNLIENAMKYGTGESDWIGVFATTAEPQKSGAAVEIRVADHGQGIPEEEQRHIFDPFFRGRRAIDEQVHGTGLGLNLVKKIVEAHGGTIRVQSEPGKGTEFVMRLPAAPELQHEFAHSAG